MFTSRSKSASSGASAVFRSIALLLLFAQVMVAQAQSSAAENLRAVYTQNGKSKIAQVSTQAGFQTLTVADDWRLVRFSKPVVPVWVSADYIYVDNNQATIIANRLNLRTEPSLQSQVLASANRGYQSQILQTRAGFAQIYAPTEVAFFLKSNADDAAPLLAGNANQVAPKSSAWRTQVASQTPSQLTPPADTSASPTQVTEAAETAVIEAAVESDPDEISPTAEQTYLLAPGDTISLRVFGEDDLSIRNMRIPQSGQVSFPLIGAFSVTGKTITTLESQLRGVLAQGYVKNPRLSVTVDSYRPIFVLGAAQSIGSFPYSEGLTVAKAIAVAGGAKFSAKAGGISLLRDGVLVHEGLAISSQLRVLPGDIISLDEELGVSEQASSYVYLHGEVGDPGEYEFRRGLTVEKAVVLAGGFTLRASRKRISVSRIVEGEEAPVKLKKVALHMPIQPGDIIDVGASWF